MHAKTADFLQKSSEYMSHLTNISENESMNIQISLCNVWYLNGILKISQEICLKKTHHLKKYSKYLQWETIIYCYF